MRQKVNKNEFLQNVSCRTGVPLPDVKAVYCAIVEEVKDVVCSGKDLSLTGFGTFMLKMHRGHPVRFNAEEGKVRDYAVLKFVVSDVLMTNVRRACGGEVPVAVVPKTAKGGTRRGRPKKEVKADLVSGAAAKDAGGEATGT